MAHGYIVTPCLQAFPRLAACVRTVADQAAELTTCMWRLNRND